MSRPAPIIAGIAAALLLLFGAYVGSYCAMRSQYQLLDDGTVTNAEPTYRSSVPSVRLVFWPAHQLDRLIRPGYWGDE